MGKNNTKNMFPNFPCDCVIVGRRYIRRRTKTIFNKGYHQLIYQFAVFHLMLPDKKKKKKENPQILIYLLRTSKTKARTILKRKKKKNLYISSSKKQKRKEYMS